MISAAKFFGNALWWSGATIYRVPARVLNVSSVPASPGLTLPSRTGLCPGGPYFKLINNSGGHAIPLKQPGGAALITMGVGTITTVVLGTTKWYAYSHAIGANRTYSSTTADRTVAVGYEAPVTPLTPPANYDPILCDGGYRRARYCANGAKAQLWMLDSEVTPHFASGVAPFSYAGQCFYFKEVDRLLLSHGELVAGADVTWYATCDLCTASLLCSFANPNMPRSIRVRIVDNVNTITDGRNDFNLGGTWTLYNDGSSQYRVDFNTPNKPAGYNILANIFIVAQCDVTGWQIGMQYGPSGFPSEMTHNEFRNDGPRTLGPTIGAYPMTGSGGTSGFGGAGIWAASTVEVLGWGV